MLITTKVIPVNSGWCAWVDSVQTRGFLEQFEKSDIDRTGNHNLKLYSFGI